MTKRRDPAADLRVRKQDGELEAFSPAKLHACLRNGLQAAGDADGWNDNVIRGMTEAVHEYLVAADPSAVVSAREIERLVELVLTETGHPSSALAVQSHAGARQRIRRHVRVITRGARNGRRIQKRWCKRVVVDHLTDEHHLERPAARWIAGRVERIILGCGLKVVTGGLVREVVRSELLAWGLAPEALAVERKGLAPAAGRPLEKPEGP